MSPLYPPGPANVPSDLTWPTPKYRRQVALVLVSLLLSLLLYLTLVAGSAWLCYWLVTASWPQRVERGYVFLRLAAIVCSGLLFLYLLKGLFKGSRQDQRLLVEITEDEQPELFDFIRRVCNDTGAPFPHKVYLSPEVNAAVFYHTSFLSLILPTPKNLLIGLGLVNMLNLSEFKAVLAHEFGHFSQKSMKVGTYVYVANKVLGDIIYGRDFLDDLMDKVKGVDLRIAIFVWIFLGVLWVLRKGLEAVFKVINIFNLSLMRQMEFNADRVAVSVAGSDAIVLGLVRSSYADQAFRQLMADLWSAADHQLYSRDMFRHQAAAGAILKRRLKKAELGERPAVLGPKVEVFKPGEGMEGIPLMWSTHPSNHDREKNAKEIYLPARPDERSPWLLFRDREEVCLRVTERYYEVGHRLEQSPQFSDPEKVQSFLDEEYAETTYADKYHGFYDNRYLDIPDLAPVLSQVRAGMMPTERALEELDELYGPDLKTWVEGYQKRLGEFDLLAGLNSGRLTIQGAMFDFRGKQRRPAEVPGLLDRLQKELDEDQRYQADRDARIFVALGQLARQQDEWAWKDLHERYQFHLGLQGLHRQVVQGLGEAHAALNFAGGRRDLSPEEFAELRGLLRQAAARLFAALDGARDLHMPPLKNMQIGQSLRVFLLQKPIVPDLDPLQNFIDPGWLQPFLAQLGEVEDKLKRILFKSMGGILAAQERIQAQARTARAASS